MFSSTLFCLLAGLRRKKNYATDFHKIWGKDGTRATGKTLNVDDSAGHVHVKVSVGLRFFFVFVFSLFLCLSALHSFHLMCLLSV